MSSEFKYIDIKNHRYYFFDNFDSNKIKIDEKSFKNIHIYDTGYVTIKDLKYIRIKCKSFIRYYQQSEQIL